MLWGVGLRAKLVMLCGPQLAEWNTRSVLELATIVIIKASLCGGALSPLRNRKKMILADVL